MARILPRLTPREARALLTAARLDRRDPRDLAAIFIVDKLRALGLLDSNSPSGFNPESGSGGISPQAGLESRSGDDLPTTDAILSIAVRQSVFDQASPRDIQPQQLTPRVVNEEGNRSVADHSDLRRPQTAAGRPS